MSGERFFYVVKEKNVKIIALMLKIFFITNEFNKHYKK